MKVPPENEQDIVLQSNIQLLHPLLDSISNIQSFNGKWSLIQSKLTELQTHLTDLSHAAVNPLSLDLLRSLASTLSDALSLSETCRSQNLPEGKLKTQNDVDSISSKLDRHIHDFQVLLSSGVLLENGAVSTSSVSRREFVRAESRSLVTRLQIGTAQSKNSALDSLLVLLQEEDKNVVIAVDQGIVPVLVRLLESSSSSEIKEKTVTAISKVSTVDSSKHVLIAEGLGLLNNLLRVLESGGMFAKEKACITLQALCHSRENSRAIGSRRGIASLLEICQAGTPSSQAYSAVVLRNLSMFSDIRENFIEENAISVLLSLSGSGTAMAQENAIGCLSNLVSRDDDLKLLVAREGGIETLKTFLDSAPMVPSLEVAVEMLRNLASCPLIAEVLVSNGILNRLVGVLNCGALGVRIAAAKGVYDFAFSIKTRKELGEIGCIPPLVRMLDGMGDEGKEAAAKALSSLLVYAGNKRIFRKEEKGIVSTVQLLDPLLKNLDKKYPVSVLSLLLYSKKCRKQIIAAGARVYLQKLVEMNVEGAKKLLDGLGHGKLWGVISRPYSRR